MYKFFLIFLVSLLSAQQNCKLFFSNNLLSKNGEVIFIVKNIDNKKIKVPKQYSNIWTRPINMQAYNEDKKDYEDTNYIADDIDCFKATGCLGKMISLKQGEFKEYKVKIIPGRISRAFEERKKYRFKLVFDTYLFSGCNDYTTDWLYYESL